MAHPETKKQPQGSTGISGDHLGVFVLTQVCLIRFTGGRNGD